MTNGERIRRMADEELARWLFDLDNCGDRIRCCKDLPECQELVDGDGGVPDEKCIGCMLDWLHREEESE